MRSLLETPMGLNETVEKVEGPIRRLAERIDNSRRPNPTLVREFSRALNAYNRLCRTSGHDKAKNDERQIPELTKEQLLAMSQEEMESYGCIIEGNPVYIPWLWVHAGEIEEQEAIPRESENDKSGH